MKTIYLHVGNFKTGTSAIQKFCSNNRSKLLKCGYDYIKSARPRFNNTNHGKLPLSLLRELGGYIPKWYNEINDFQCVSKAVIEEIESSSCDNIIISSEEFYRIPGQNTTIVQSAANELRDAFSDYNVQVVMYVREPLEMAKSWYNQANKPNVPTRRFMDFFYYMNTSLLLPQMNATFWRGCFGADCLILEPYGLTGAKHIQRFFELIEAEVPFVKRAPATLINKKRNKKTLELDRIARITRIKDEKERATYLDSFVLKSPKNTKMVQAKIDSINHEFLAFCQAEGLAFQETEFSLDNLMTYEGEINCENKAADSLFKRKLAQIRYSRIAHYIKKTL
jgi:hypothetical protein